MRLAILLVVAASVMVSGCVSEAKPQVAPTDSEEVQYERIDPDTGKIADEDAGCTETAAPADHGNETQESFAGQAHHTQATFLGGGIYLTGISGPFDVDPGCFAISIEATLTWDDPHGVAGEWAFTLGGCAEESDSGTSPLSISAANLTLGESCQFQYTPMGTANIVDSDFKWAGVVTSRGA